jgi:hypothetical protein
LTERFRAQAAHFAHHQCSIAAKTAGVNCDNIRRAECAWNAVEDRTEANDDKVFPDVFAASGGPERSSEGSTLATYLRCSLLSMLRASRALIASKIIPDALSPPSRISQRRRMVMRCAVVSLIVVQTLIRKLDEARAAAKEGLALDPSFTVNLLRIDGHL